jgi:hypothetical protein
MAPSPLRWARQVADGITEERPSSHSLIIYDILVPCGPTPFKGEPGNEHFSHLDVFSLLCSLF